MNLRLARLTALAAMAKHRQNNAVFARVLEVELMDTAEEAADYDAMDHGTVNIRFAQDALKSLAGRSSAGPVRVLDVGTGTALIPIEIARLEPSVQILGIDLAEHMLASARRNIEHSGFAARVQVACIDAKSLPLKDTFDLVVSNSLVHHIAEPARVLRAMLDRCAPGGTVFIRDLLRPDNRVTLDALVTMYAGGRPAEAAAAKRYERQKQLFADSLHAALTLDEIRSCAATIGIHAECIQVTSDRHWTLTYQAKA
jgi:SAM-dependent methyltransferase